MERNAARRALARARWRVAGVIGVVVVAMAVFVALDRYGEPSTVSAPSSTTGVQPGGSTSGWFFVDGEVRTLVDSKTVARFPDHVAPDARPVRVVDGFVAATAHGEVSDLWWSGSPDVAYAVRLATSVSGVAASRDGTSMAYSKVEPGGVGPSTLVVSDAVTNKVRSTAQFPTFARVVGYADSIVILETGDGGRTSAAVWIPSTGQITPLPAYRGVGGVGEGFAVLHEGDRVCPVLVALSEAGVTEQSRPSLDPACATDQWSVGPDGPSAVGFGIPASPERVRLSLPDGTTSALPVDAVDGIWLDSSTFVLIDGDGNLDVCDTARRCQVVRPLASRATSVGAQWLIAPLSKRDSGPEQPGPAPSTTAPTQFRNVR